MPEPRITVHHVPSLFAEAQRKARAKVERERAGLPPIVQAVLRDFEREYDRLLAKQFVGGSKDA